MRYLDISWQHDSDDDPYRMVLEIGADGLEKRKLEFFKNGGVGYASEIESSGSTMLGSNPIPKLEVITSQAEFSGERISEDLFEQLWHEHVIKGNTN